MVDEDYEANPSLWLDDDIVDYSVAAPEDLRRLIGSALDTDALWKKIQASPEGGQVFPEWAARKHEYGTEFPNKLQKLLEPFGGTVERGRVDTLPTGARRQHNRQLESTEAWIAKLSPEMKQQIREKGFPMLMLLLAMQQAELAEATR